MRYILDFDETLFDTNRLKEKMRELDIPEKERTVESLDALADADPAFDITELVYPDVWDFLRTHGRECYIVSTALSRDPENNTSREMQHAFQLEKIARAGITDFVPGKHIHITVNESKQELLEMLRDEIARTGEEAFYIDDQNRYLSEARNCGFRVLRMDRAGGGGRSPEGIEGGPGVIGSLAELEAHDEAA